MIARVKRWSLGSCRGRSTVPKSFGVEEPTCSVEVVFAKTSLRSGALALGDMLRWRRSICRTFRVQDAPPEGHRSSDVAGRTGVPGWPASLSTCSRELGHHAASYDSDSRPEHRQRVRGQSKRGSGASRSGAEAFGRPRHLDIVNRVRRDVACGRRGGGCLDRIWDRWHAGASRTPAWGCSGSGCQSA